MGILRAGLGGMLGVVEADAHQFADAADAGAEADRRFDQRQRRRIDRPQSRERRGGEGLAGDVVDHAARGCGFCPAASTIPGCSSPRVRNAVVSLRWLLFAGPSYRSRQSVDQSCNLHDDFRPAIMTDVLFRPCKAL